MDPTYELISKQILTSNQTDVIFSNIPQGYKDLVINISARSPVGLENILMQFNGSSSGYSSRHLRGSGSAAASFDQTAFGWGSTSLFTTYTDATSNTFSNAEIYIPNYSGVTNKCISATGVQETNSTTAYILATAGAWSNTSPITSIRFYGNGSSLVASSSFYLYGIKNADDGGRGFFGPAMTGGDEVYTTGDGYKYHIFKNSGTLNVTAPGEVECLVVGGGAAGGSGYGGGGGAGGLISTNYLLENNQYSIIIGAGGSSVSAGSGTRGNNTILGKFIANGGGGGGGWNTAIPGVDGGSGGGAAGGAGLQTVGSPAGLSTQIGGFGNSGGTGYRGSNTLNGGGGGGAGSTGQSAPQNTNRNGSSGGNGVVWPTNSNSYYSGGGGGCASSNGNIGLGGLGGGGNGARWSEPGSSTSVVATNGSANTGSGGGGAGDGSTFVGPSQVNSGSGGSGIVIIRYRI